MNEYWKPFVHTSLKNPNPHTDMETPTGRIHLNIDESQFLAEKHGVELKPTNSFLPSHLNDIMRK